MVIQLPQIFQYIFVYNTFSQKLNKRLSLNQNLPQIVQAFPKKKKCVCASNGGWMVELSYFREFAEKEAKI